MPSRRILKLLRGAALGFSTLILGGAADQGCHPSPKQPPTVVLESDSGPVRVRVEVVFRSEEKTRGLMYRQHLDPDAGMLFVYPTEDLQTFWMKNTYIPLDLVFIGSNRQILGMVEGSTPLSLQRLQIDIPSQFVLEVNAGFVKKHRIREGGKVRFEGVQLDR